jgi:hypothetical protein
MTGINKKQFSRSNFIKNVCTVLFIGAAFTSCKNNEGPDVSGVKYDLEISRFEQDFFKIDTNNIAASFQSLGQKYPVFLNDFNVNILGLPPAQNGDTAVFAAIKQFVRDYKPIKDSVDKTFGDISRIGQDVEKGMKHVLHYFPSYKAPKKLITFVGPMDAYYEASLGGQGDVITTEGLAVGLQLHLGSNFSFYKSPMGQSLYPDYISKRFTPQSIPVNCIKNVIDDLYPDKSGSLTLVEQMVEKGKRMYLLDKFMPDTEDTLKIGYSKAQLAGCYDNEGLIWNFFVTNSFVYNNDPSIIKNYIGESPKTQEFGEGAPGNIGLFIGWRIVQAYMDKQENMNPDKLMETSPKTIFEESKYRPK